MVRGNFLSKRLEILGAVLAKGANEIGGKGVAVVYVATDLAYVALGFGCLGLGLDIGKIVGVGHGFLVRNDLCLCEGANEHAVRVKVNILLDFERKEGVDVLGQVNQSVFGAGRGAVGKFVDVLAALEAEMLKDRKGRFGGQATHVHLSRPLNGVVRIVAFVDGDGNAGGGVGYLGDSVDDKTVVFHTIV